MHQDGAVQTLHGLSGTGGLGADDDAVGFHEVLDAVALGEEVGVAGDVKLDVGSALLEGLGDDFGDLQGRTYRDCRLDDKHAVLGDVLPEVLGNVKDGAQVGRAVLIGGGVDGAEDKVLVDKALFIVAQEREPLVVDVAVDHVVQSRLIDGD